MRRAGASWLVAGCCAALSASVSIPRAIDYPFWQDEVGAARAAVAASPVTMLRTVAADESTPPGFFGSAWLLHELGAPVVWGRAISVVAAALLAALVVLYAGRFLPLWSAALAGATCALAWQFVDHGWELRAYSLLALTSSLAAWAAERAAERPDRGRLVALAAVVAVGSMTHYFFLLTLVAIVLWLALTGRLRPLRRIPLALALGLLPLLAWSPAFVRQYQHNLFAYQGPFSTRAVVQSYAALLSRSIPAGTVGHLIGLATLALVLIGAAVLWRGPEAARLCALCAVVPVAAAAVVWLIGPHIFDPRNLIEAAPFAAITIASALTAPPRPAALAVAAAAAALLGFVFVRGDGPIVPPYDRVAASLADVGWQRTDPIVVFGPVYAYMHPLDWYLPRGERLDVARPADRPCPTVFVVSVHGHGAALAAGAERRSRVGAILVARLRWRDGIWRAMRRGRGRVIATRLSACTRPE